MHSETTLPTSAPTGLPAEARRAPETRLRGYELWVARAAWLAVTLLVGVLFLASYGVWVRALKDDVYGFSPALGQIGLTLEFFTAYVLTIEAVFMAVFALTAAFIFAYRSDDRMGIFVSLTFVLMAVALLPPMVALGRAEPALYGVTVAFRALALTCAIALQYLFPDGQFVPRWTRLLLVVWAGYCLTWFFIPALIPPTDFVSYRTSGEIAVGLWLLGWLGTGLYAQVYRYRHVSGPMQRQQTKWVVLGTVGMFAAVFAAALPVFLFPALRTPGPAFMVYLLIVIPTAPIGFVCIPLSIAFAILRYRLWDVDVLLNRTLVYGLLTGALAVIYAACVLGLQMLFPALMGNSSPVIVAISTLATAIAFNPLRQRIQRGIDYRFFRQKYDAAQMVADFSARARDEVDLQRLAERLERVIEETIRPAHVLTWLRTPIGFSVPFGSDMPVTPIRDDDPLAAYLRAARGVVQVERLSLNSPALEALRSAHVQVIVPLVSQGELTGWLSLGPRLNEQAYAADSFEMLTALAAQAAPALRVAQLAGAQRTEAVARERVEHELRLAQNIQQSLLPKEAPAVPGWQMGTHYRPAREVGGDFYDFMPFEDGRIGIVIGDVSGKGMPAALVMATTRSFLRSTGRSGRRTPGQVLQRVNDLLQPDLPPGMFVTCLYAILNPANGRLVFANAGHNLPIRRGAEGVLELRACGTPLGMLPERDYDEHEAVIAPGEQVLFYSDGLTEAHDARRAMFGEERLRALMAQHPGHSAELINGVLAELAAFTGADAQQEDDLTLVAVQRAG